MAQNVNGIFSPAYMDQYLANSSYVQNAVKEKTEDIARELKQAVQSSNAVPEVKEHFKDAVEFEIIKNPKIDVPAVGVVRMDSQMRSGNYNSGFLLENHIAWNSAHFEAKYGCVTRIRERNRGEAIRARRELRN